MEQVAAGLNLAGTPDVRFADADGVERVAARDDDVVGEDGAELERKGVERTLELALGQQQRRREARVAPLADALRAGLQIVPRHGVDDRERVQLRLDAMMRAPAVMRMQRVTRRVKAVGAQRLQTGPED